MTNPTPHGPVPEALIDLIDAYAEARHRYGRIYNARTEAARNAVIEALSGVQALSAGPAGFVPVAAFDRLHAHAESLAARLLAAEQQAPKAAPGEPSAFPMTGDEEESDLGQWQPGTAKPNMDGTYLREFDEGEATSEFHQGVWLRDGFFPSDLQDVRWRGRTAPQQEAQEPVAWQSRTRPTWGANTSPWSHWEPCTKGQAEDYWKTPLLHDWAYEARALYTAPQAAPVAQADAEDAARYRWLVDYLISDRYYLDDAIIACDSKQELDDVIDAARKQGGKT